MRCHPLWMLVLWRMAGLRIEDELRVAQLSYQRKPVLASGADVMITGDDQQGDVHLSQAATAPLMVCVVALGSSEIALKQLSAGRDSVDNAGARINPVV